MQYKWNVHFGECQRQTLPHHGIWPGTQIHSLRLFTSKIFHSHLLPGPIFNQYQCSLYLSHDISLFLMVPLKLSSSTFLSILGCSQMGLKVIISPQKHSAFSRIEISETMFGFLFLLLNKNLVSSLSPSPFSRMLGKKNQVTS